LTAPLRPKRHRHHLQRPRAAPPRQRQHRTLPRPRAQPAHPDPQAERVRRLDSRRHARDRQGERMTREQTSHVLGIIRLLWPRSYRPAGTGDPYAGPPAGYWSHPLIGRFMVNAWDEWRLSRETDGTFQAQQREAWKALAARAERGVALTAIGAPRRRGLERPDY